MHETIMSVHTDFNWYPLQKQVQKVDQQSIGFLKTKPNKSVEKNGKKKSAKFQSQH